MKNRNYILLFAIISLPLFSQSKWNIKYYDSLTVDNFRSFKPFHQKIDVTNFDSRLANAAVFFVTNEIRRKKKRTVVPYNKNLEVAAYYHSKDMAENLYFNHINKKDSKRKTPDDRARMAGIANPYIAENITEGFILDYIALKPVYPKGKGKFSYTTDGKLIEPITYLQLAEKLLKAWMNSPPHKENIMSKNNMELGCGVVQYLDNDFNEMPMVKATQLFQQFEKVRANYAFDKLP